VPREVGLHDGDEYTNRVATVTIEFSRVEQPAETAIH
jgi:hypothetical protein